jgi:Fe-S-cluster containining protein
MRPPTPAHLGTLARKTDDWFKRAAAALLSQVPCHGGCSHCCIGVFPITRLDARLLQEGLSQLADHERRRIVDRASQQKIAMEAVEPRLAGSPSIAQWPDTDIDHVVAAFQHVPCPALSEDGLCSLYAHRPLTCRSMGIPIREGAMVSGACNVQTFVPIVRLPASLETEEETLARRESAELAMLPEVAQEGEEVLLPYGFVSCGVERD